MYCIRKLAWMDFSGSTHSIRVFDWIEYGWDSGMEASSLDTESIGERYPCIDKVRAESTQLIQEDNTLASIASNHQCRIHAAPITGTAKLQKQIKARPPTLPRQTLTSKHNWGKSLVHR